MDNGRKHFYEFDAFRIDVAERQLLRRDEPVPLTPKVFDLLLLLVANSGRTLDKNSLLEQVWADSFVEEGNLNRNVSTLRKALGDDSHEPRFIKTLPKRGYRFVGEVREVWEEDETVTVENRTRYHLKVREEVVKEGETKRKGDREIFRRVAVVVLVLLTVAVAALMWRRAQKSEARALMKGAEDAAAFELYQRGRALWQTRNGEKLHEATTLLEQAVRQDPNFALAHSALADAYAFDYTNWKRAEGAAREAMRLDPKLGEPHAAVGFVKMFWEWKLREAEAEFKQALQLNPHYATAHQWHAALLAATCRLDAAYAEMSQALGLEPDSPAVNADMCQTLYFMRRYDEALAQCRKTLDANPDFFNAHRYLYEIYAANGMFDEAVAQHFKTEEAAGVKMPPAVNEKLRQAYASGGIRAFWRLRIEALAAGNAPLRYQLAQNYARLGDTEAALKWLREAYEKRDVEFLLFYADPAFDNLRHDPRYQNLMALLFPLN